MIQQNLLEVLLGWLGGMLRDLLESIVGWSKDCVVRSSSVQKGDKIVILVDEGCKFGSIFAFSNELIDRHIRLMVVAMMAMMFMTSIMAIAAIDAVGLGF